MCEEIAYIGTEMSYRFSWGTRVKLQKKRVNSRGHPDVKVELASQLEVGRIKGILQSGRGNLVPHSSTGGISLVVSLRRQEVTA